MNGKSWTSINKVLKPLAYPSIVWDFDLSIPRNPLPNGARVLLSRENTI